LLGKEEEFRIVEKFPKIFKIRQKARAPKLKDVKKRVDEQA